MLFGLFFYSSPLPSQISPTADYNGAAIPPPIFSMPMSNLLRYNVISASKHFSFTAVVNEKYVDVL